jgi:hypothetical protein
LKRRCRARDAGLTPPRPDGRTGVVLVGNSTTPMEALAGTVRRLAVEFIKARPHKQTLFAQTATKLSERRACAHVAPNCQPPNWRGVCRCHATQTAPVAMAWLRRSAILCRPLVGFGWLCVFWQLGRARPKLRKAFYYTSA